MKLAVLLLQLVLTLTIVKSGNAETADKVAREDLLKSAALQLERLSWFRRTREPQPVIVEVSSKDNEPQPTAEEVKAQEDIIEAQKRIDELRESASAVLEDPQYASIMQDRIKRSFISGIANKLIGGAVGTVSGLSRGVADLSSSNSPAEYGSYGHSYGSQFGLLDFKKAIINTLIQAIKALGGGAIAGGGALVKGGGYLISAKGRLISSAGDVLATLGKSLASSAIIAAPKPVYGHPGYAYHPQSLQYPSHDAIYDGPPPNTDAYIGPNDAYNAAHSKYPSPSNDDAENNDAGLVVVKETKLPDVHNEEHPPEAPKPNLSALDESFGGPSKESSTFHKIVGVLNSAQVTSVEGNHQSIEHVNHYTKQTDHQTSLNTATQQATYVTPISHDNHENYHDDLREGHYQADAPIYDSYGTKLQPASPQLSGAYGNTHQPEKNHHEALTLQIQGLLNPHLANPSSLVDYHYHANQQNPEALKILENQNNHLEHHTHEQSGTINYYGPPPYADSPPPIHPMVVPHANPPAPPISMLMPYYQNFPYYGPMDFGQHHSGESAVLGAWSRMMNRRNAVVWKKAASRRNAL